MRFKTHNDDPGININGTSYQGVVTAEYHKLVELFGKPTEGDGYKVDAEWDIQFDDGMVATIYNWKDGKNYCGRSGTATRHITEWHIGGRRHIVVGRVMDIINGVIEGESQRIPEPTRAPLSLGFAYGDGK